MTWILITLCFFIVFVGFGYYLYLKDVGLIKVKKELKMFSLSRFLGLSFSILLLLCFVALILASIGMIVIMYPEELVFLTLIFTVFVAMLTFGK